LRSSRDVSNSYRKTSVSLLTVEGLGNKHWRCPSPTPLRSTAVRLVLFLLGPPSYIKLFTLLWYIMINGQQNIKVLQSFYR
jgi:hypothetical protein